MATSIHWVEWTSKRKGTTKAFAVDPDHQRDDGKLRAVNGALVPDDATPAKRSTEKDEFCVSILEKRKADKAAAVVEKPARTRKVAKKTPAKRQRRAKAA